MGWQITHDGTDHTVDVEALGDGVYRVTVDGTAHEVTANTPEAGVLHLVHDGRHLDADVVRTDGGRAVTIGGRRHDLMVIDERQLALAALGLGGAGAGDNIVSTSMPGKVVTLLVSEGDVVAEGQGVIVVEAMKMENELKAPMAGVVASIEVGVGDAVEGGATLVVLEPAGD